MANISKIKRDRMLTFLNNIRESHKDDDDVLISINEIENEILNKKYGLVWEEHSEEVEERMAEETPVFTEVHDKEISLTDGSYNFLLEGDNLHSLHLLEKTHREKIDVIYIDPPYNTGSNDFIYDDQIVGTDDTFRHSKWLSFMSKRLRIAKKLLKDTGFIMVSINDIELCQLRMLCDQIFGEQNFLATLVWQSTPGSNTGTDIKTVTEYIVCYASNKPLSHTGTQLVDCDESKYKLSDSYEAKRGKFTINKLDRRMTGHHYSESLNYPIAAPDGSMIYPGGLQQKQPHWNWRWSKEKVEWGIKNDFILFRKSPDGRWAIYFKQYYLVDNNDTPIVRALPYQNLLKIDGANSARGTQEVMSIMNRKAFDYPKPLSLMKYILGIHSSKDITVLDFFAGSGTTGQAVLELNKEDGGSRKFILCTNNENNICEDVTYPRLQTIITGIRQDGKKYSDGIPTNLKYYKTDYVSKKSDNLTSDLINHINEMIQLEYHVKIDKEKYISILSDEDADELEKNWEKYPNICAIYISRNVLLNATQRNLFESKECFVIPDYYFRNELKEAGEA